MESPKILIVEDDPFMIELLSLELQKAGFALTVAKTGRECVASVINSKPDLILLDLLLPDQNGFEALREIRRMPEGPKIKVIVLSNMSETPDLEEAKLLGTVDYLVKTNFTLSDIVERIKQALVKN